MLLVLMLPVLLVNSLSTSSSSETFRQLRISFVTGNEMKAREMNRILADHGATKGPTPETSLVDLNVLNVDLPEIQEVDTIAIGKADRPVESCKLRCVGMSCSAKLCATHLFSFYTHHV